MPFFLNFVSFFESLKHIRFPVVNFNYIFLQSFYTCFSCIPVFKQIILKYKMQMVNGFKIFFMIWKTKESPLVNCECNQFKKIQETNLLFWEWNMKLYFPLIFSGSSVFINFHWSFWLSVIIRDMKWQKTNINWVKR